MTGVFICKGQHAGLQAGRPWEDKQDTVIHKTRREAPEETNIADSLISDL